MGAKNLRRYLISNEYHNSGLHFWHTSNVDPFRAFYVKRGSKWSINAHPSTNTCTLLTKCYMTGYEHFQNFKGGTKDVEEKHENFFHSFLPYMLFVRIWVYFLNLLTPIWNLRCQERFNNCRVSKIHVTNKFLV